MTPEDDEELDDEDEAGSISALARNSSGDVIGVTFVLKEFENKLELQLYGVKASANLAKELRDKGLHDGPVVYESSHAACLHESCEGEPEVILRKNMPRDQDLDDVSRSCQPYCGSPNELKEMLPPDLSGCSI